MSGADDSILSGQAWSRFCRSLEQAGQVILDVKAPTTPLDTAEGFRYLTRLLRNSLYATIENSDPDRPRWQGLDLVKIGADNPDNVYHSAPVTGTNAYRITGTRGTIAYTSFGSKANRYAKDGTMASTGELRHHDIRPEPDGTVEIIASVDEPADARNWLPLAEDSTIVVLRESYLDRESEVPGAWEIERLGDPLPREPLTTEHVARSLERTTRAVIGTAATFASWTERFRTRPNELPDWGQDVFQRAGGDPEIFYLHGYWALGPGQAWVIETEVPDCPYWNFQLDNVWMESMDWDERITVNKHTAELNDDGTLTLVVSATDPGWGNWIDTTGHSSGTALLRWVGADHHPLPSCRVVDR